MNRYRPREYDTEDGPWDPISGGASALLGTIGSLMMGVADFPLELFRALQGKPVRKAPNIVGLQNTAGTSSMTSDHIAESSRSAILQESVGSVELSSASPHPRSPSQAIATTAPENGSPSTNPSEAVDHSSTSQSPAKNLNELSRHVSFEAAIGTGKGVGRIVGAGLKSPMDFTLGLAKGFRNAPRLYGDESVRPIEKITGLQSGLKVASKVRILCRYSVFSLN